MKTVIVLDCDGVIYDTMGALKKYLAARGIRWRLPRQYDLTPDPHWPAIQEAFASDIFWASVKPFDGVPSVIQDIQKYDRWLSIIAVSAPATAPNWASIRRARLRLLGIDDFRPMTPEERLSFRAAEDAFLVDDNPAVIAKVDFPCGIGVRCSYNRSKRFMLPHEAIRLASVRASLRVGYRKTGPLGGRHDG